MSNSRPGVGAMCPRTLRRLELGAIELPGARPCNGRHAGQGSDPHDERL